MSGHTGHLLVQVHDDAEEVQEEPGHKDEIREILVRPKENISLIDCF